MNYSLQEPVMADLHCHTQISDGRLTPQEVVVLAARKGLSVMAITDHDSASGVAAAEREGAGRGIEVIPGIEFNTDWQGTEVHILGYGIDATAQMLRQQLAQLQAYRKERAAKILEKLRVSGIFLSFQQLSANVPGETFGRPHIARTLVQYGYVSDEAEAFRCYLRKGAPAYIPGYKITSSEGIRLIRQIGGVPVLAHPGKEDYSQVLPEWIANGLQGIEVVHPDHDARDEGFWLSTAQRYRLLISGGSDFHGPDNIHGADLGSKGVSLAVVSALKDQALRNQKEG
ncbi:MAG: PHP domain-containing protein [Peptococcaceae bacterium]|jgi:predicted metal-dependent phosphoesterase TrpH|nr:PHP domain-containing protein [Peptococcaceae bacterium]